MRLRTLVACCALLSLADVSAASDAAWVATDANAGNSLKTVNFTGPATQLVFVTTPQVIEDTPGTSGTMTVQEQDGLGNPVDASAAVSVTLSSGSANVTFSPLSPVTIAAGASTVSFTITDTVDTAPKAVTAAAAGMQSATQTEAFHAAPASTTVTVGSQSGSLSPNGTATFSVQVKNTGTGHGYSLTNVGGLPSGAMWGATACATNAGSGAVTTFTLTVTATTSTPAAASAYAITVTATRWKDTADCNVTGGISEAAEGTGSLTVNAGAASKVAFTIQPGGATSSGGAFAVQPKVAVEDANGNVVTSASATVALTLQGSGTLGGCTTGVATVSGVATFSACAVTGTLDIVNDTLTATAAGGFSGTVVSSTFDITGVATKLAFLIQPQGDAGAGALSLQPVVVVEDAGGNVVTASAAQIALAPSLNTLACPRSGTTVTASHGSATFGACAITTTASGYTLTASSTGLTSATSTSFSVTKAAPTITAPSPGTPQAFAATETVTFTVSGTKFAYGATAADSGGLFTIDGWTWTSATQLSVTATCTAIGTDGLVVTDPDSGTATASSSLTASA